MPDDPSTTPESVYAREQINARDPTPEQAARIARLKDAAATFHALAQQLMPAGRHRALALTKIEEAAMWATKSIVMDFADAPPPTSPYGDAPRAAPTPLIEKPATE